MTDEELGKMISEFLPYPAEGQHHALKQFAKLVEAAEREACARVCDDLVLAHPGRADLTAQQCAAAIRERGAP
jgi:hypothetical protein